jgi:hypothetical protein
MTQHKLQISMLATLFALAFVPFACGAENPVTDRQHRVVGEKLDSGLGSLPHYRHWATRHATGEPVALSQRVPGEKLDSGLGSLPHYRHWTKHSATKRLVVLAEH